MLTTWVAATGRIELRDAPIPALRDGTVLIRTTVAAICGSDLHRLRRRGPAEETSVIGHESVGVVVASADDRFAAGARVLHAPLPEDGRAFAEFQLADAGKLVPVPPGLEDRRAVYAQQLGTVLFALDGFLAGRRAPADALVIGAGPAGLLFARALRDAGAAVSVVEPLPWRADRAADHAEVFADVEQFLSRGRRVELVIDCSGASAAIERGVEACSDGGVLGLFGIPDDDGDRVRLRLWTLIERNITVRGAVGAQSEEGLRSFRRAMDLIATERVRVDDLTSHVLPLARIADALERSARVAPGTVKVVVEVS